jgi:hypothetical protein
MANLFDLGNILLHVHILLKKRESSVVGWCFSSMLGACFCVDLLLIGRDTHTHLHMTYLSACDITVNRL